MKIIKKLVKMIDEELGDAKKYAECALREKEENPTLANLFYTLSLEEMKHMNILHGEAVKMIEDNKAKHGEPPAAMQAIYDWEHEKQIEESKEIKILQNHYREHS